MHNYFLFMTNFGADTPFILLAKITVKEDKVTEYLELADKFKGLNSGKAKP